MTLDQFLTFIATVLGAVGSIYVLKSILRLTPELTERAAATMWGHSLVQVDSLSSQKAEGVVGTYLIFIALLLMVANTAIMPSGIIVNQDRLFAIFLALFLSSIIWLLLFIVSKTVERQHRRATARIIVAMELNDLFKMEIIKDREIRPLRHLSENYLNLKSSKDKSNKEFLHFLADNVGCTFPKDIQIEDDPSIGQL